MKTMLFYPPLYYKTILKNGKMDKQYWKEIVAKFIKQDIT